MGTLIRRNCSLRLCPTVSLVLFDKDTSAPHVIILRRIKTPHLSSELYFVQNTAFPHVREQPMHEIIFSEV